MKEIHDCRTCVFMKELYKQSVNGVIVKCIPLDYYSSQAARLIPRIVTEKECSKYLFSQSKMEELMEAEEVKKKKVKE